MSALEEVVDSALSKYFEVINTKPKTEDEDPLLNFYNDKSMLTFGERRLGAKRIVELLRKEKREFTIDSYSYGSVDENHVIITGFYLLGNSKLPFTIGLESQIGGNDEVKIYISNQIMK